MWMRRSLFAIAGIPFSLLPATAQNVVDAGNILLDDWSYETLYASEAWSVDTLFGRDVSGDGGDRVGDFEDLVLNDAGEVVALIVEVGGFLDIGDTHVSVPWTMVQFGTDGSVSVPLDEDSISGFRLFADPSLPEEASIADEIVQGVEDAELDPGLWRASDLMGDHVRVQDEDGLWVNYGFLTDLMIDDGAIAATLVTTGARYGPGTRAYPFGGDATTGYGVWDPGAPTYDLPILVDDATSYPQFDAERMKERAQSN